MTRKQYRKLKTSVLDKHREQILWWWSQGWSLRKICDALFRACGIRPVPSTVSRRLEKWLQE